jgi:uncharacterized protein (DUF111 family)
VDKVVCSPLPIGSGFINCLHGRIPVPAPATVEILKGVPVYSNGITGELITPTGATIVTQFVGRYGNMPFMKIDKIGCGCGKKEFSIPNIVRLFFGSDEQQEQCQYYYENLLDKLYKLTIKEQEEVLTVEECKKYMKIYDILTAAKIEIPFAIEI